MSDQPDILDTWFRGLRDREEFMITELWDCFIEVIKNTKVFATLFRIASSVPYKCKAHSFLAEETKTLLREMGAPVWDEFSIALQRQWCLNPWGYSERSLDDPRIYKPEHWVNLNAFVTSVSPPYCVDLGQFAMSAMSLALDKLVDQANGSDFEVNVVSIWIEYCGYRIYELCAERDNAEWENGRPSPGEESSGGYPIEGQWLNWMEKLLLKRPHIRTDSMIRKWEKAFDKMVSIEHEIKETTPLMIS
ncbi:hypothetical protein ED733_008003 [Metarhizium rileyi]|uniref:Uncharacterized protein n=1 Tax=Metarhizium rileyi (strain RCEF 4871) TaxID=1649241 RepID=A0A5C6GI88_METRR|nr:hypothetical protein ED733_008003 [Metarhizium rileyi]